MAISNRQLFTKVIGQTSHYPMLVEIERAEGVFMYGTDGKEYIDLISGVSVNNIGHCHPKVVEAVKEQAASYMHLMVYGEIVQDIQVKYAAQIAGVLPSKLDNCFFVNSGSEAVEGAIKLAKRYTGKNRIISFRNAYHGSTHGALSIQGSEIYKNAFRPLIPNVFLADFNSDAVLDQIDSKTACVIVEPVQGEAGVVLPENNFLDKLRKKCTATGALLIFDEVQTGFGRTGYMFALDRYKVVPDILLLAKALGGGMPLGAFIASKEIMSALASDPPLGHITTSGGNPVCCAAGLASFNIIIEDKLAEHANRKSEQFKKELVHPLISEVRGEGLMLAIKITDPEYISFIVTNAPDFGLILDYFLFCNNAIRIAPPLIIKEPEIIYACGQLKKLLDHAMKNVKVK